MGVITSYEMPGGIDPGGNPVSGRKTISYLEK